MWLCHRGMWDCHVHIVDVLHNVMLGEQMLQKFVGVQLLRFARFPKTERVVDIWVGHMQLRDMGQQIILGHELCGASRPQATNHVVDLCLAHLLR